MAFQTGSNLVVAYKPEVTFNTAPGTSSAFQHRFNPSGGLNLKRASSVSDEIRSDMLGLIPRLGSGQTPGQFDSELSVGSFDTLLEAALRSTWVAAASITQSAMTSITTTTSTIVAAAGSWITQGVRVGDVVRLTGHATTANNSINLRVKAVTASTITLHGTPLTADAVADTSFTLTILKKLKNGATPTRRSFYWDVYNQDLDLSIVFGGVRVVGFEIEGGPNEIAKIRFMLLGASATELASGSSPYYVTPTQYTSTALHFADATLSLGGSDIATATSFKMSYMLDAEALDVIGNAGVPADIVDSRARVTGQMSFAMSDLTNFGRYRQETELELHILLTEVESEPKDCISLYLPRIKFTDRDAPITGTAMVESFPFAGGPKESTTGYDSTLLTICTSAA